MLRTLAKVQPFGLFMIFIFVVACSQKPKPVEQQSQALREPYIQNSDSSSLSFSEKDKQYGVTEAMLKGSFGQKFSDTVWFLVDQSTLTADARRTLYIQARWLGLRPGTKIKIAGHADERGTRAYNLALSARRANAVRLFLVANGIEPANIQTLSFGKERPLVTCENESCWAKNRRAKTRIDN